MTQALLTTSDNLTLGGTLYAPQKGGDWIVLNGATAVPQQFYKRFAEHMAAKGFSVLTYDYRGMGASKPYTLRGFPARCADWGTKDIAAAIDFVSNTYSPGTLYLIGHSAGGQQAALADRSDKVSAMLSVSSQSGYWGLQGGAEKRKVWFLTKFMIPTLTRIFGYFPWGAMGGMDLPKHVALDWARWCQTSGYLLDDPSLPLHLYDTFQAPVLAYSIADDDWGTEPSVKAMMSAYPNVTFEHLQPADWDVPKLGHMGYFRKGSERLWDEAAHWLRSQT